MRHDKTRILNTEEIVSYYMLSKKLLQGLGLVLIGFLTGYVIRVDTKQHISDKFAPEFRSDNGTLTNPLLECNVGVEFKFKEKESLATSLENLKRKEIAADKIDHGSIYFRDLNNGPVFGIDEGEKFAPASLLKIPILIAFLKSSEEDPSLLEKKIRLKDLKDLSVLPQNFAPEETLDHEKEYTAREFLERMIIYSDNYARAAITSLLKPEQLEKIFRDLAIPLPDAESSSEDFIDVQSYARFFRILFNASYLSRENSEYALSLLVRVSFSPGLRSGVPENVKMAHKFGERIFKDGKREIKQLHDCGIVYYPGHPYLACIMTRGTDFNKMASFIREVSAQIYEKTKNQYPLE